ncbi:MAG: hydrogen gas-evolving membrane-bound hydrogenase subunit E [Oceanipulchritudo sp.]
MQWLAEWAVLAGLGLPWVALLLLQVGGPWSRGSNPGKWLWLVPALATTGFIVLAGAGGGTGTERIELLSWIPDQGITLGIQVDGLSLFFGLVVAGMGTLIFGYTAGYFEGKPEEFRRFYTYLLFFLGAMLGTVFSDNLLILYAWWEMTGIASFFLIGYLHEDKEAREGARMALVTTVGTGMCLLAGILLVGLTAGTFAFTELIAVAPRYADSTLWNAGFLLIVVGAFGKSAQFPFHYWLPNAMAAPTPVSAYLHSATMVKLGVFLIARVFPIFRPLDSWVPVLLLVGFFTFLLGATFSLLSHKLKAILAFSTVSQLGFLIGFYGMSPPQGTHLDMLHIINHVFYKGALFMVVGIIDHSTGIKDIRQLGGLRKRMPLLYWITLISAGSMAGLIFTSGFLSKEYMLKEKIDYLMEGLFLNFYPILMVVTGSVFKVAFSLRLFLHVFHGKESPELDRHFHKPGFLIQLPPLLLTTLTLVTGIFPYLMYKALLAFRVPGLHDPNIPKLKIWHGWDSAAFLISCGILLAGYVLYRFAEKDGWQWARIPPFLRVDVLFTNALDALPGMGARASRWLGVDHPKVHLAVIIAVALVWIGLPAYSAFGTVPEPEFLDGNLFIYSLAAALLFIAGGSLLLLPSWKGQVVMVGVIGFLVTFYFVLYRAPDLALTQILVEAASLILLLVLFQRFPLLRTITLQPRRGVARLNGVLAAGMGILMFVLTLVFAGARKAGALGEEYLEASLPLAKGTNAVNTILVDFRGFDTLLEIGVLVIATLGIIGLMRKKKAGGEHAG